MPLDIAWEIGTSLTIASLIESLDYEMERTLISMYKYLAIAKRIAPFSTRKMAFMCRIMFSEMRKRQETLHSVWERLDIELRKINEIGLSVQSS